MATLDQLAALKLVYAQALTSEHIWPGMAACEAMVETGWMQSTLAREYNNLFGLKHSVANQFLKVTLPTQEYLGGNWVSISAQFVWYPGFSGIAHCFSDRMHTLERLAPEYPDYAAALHASDPESYVTAVSKSWSTDPTRATKCVATYRAHRDILNRTSLETI